MAGSAPGESQAPSSAGRALRAGLSGIADRLGWRRSPQNRPCANDPAAARSPPASRPDARRRPSVSGLWRFGRTSKDRALTCAVVHSAGSLRFSRRRRRAPTLVLFVDVAGVLMPICPLDHRIRQARPARRSVSRETSQPPRRFRQRGHPIGLDAGPAQKIGQVVFVIEALPIRRAPHRRRHQPRMHPGRLRRSISAPRRRAAAEGVPARIIDQAHTPAPRRSGAGRRCPRAAAAGTRRGW